MSEHLQALDDILVLDIATFIAAPFAASSLAEFGARVIKIEKPVEGDYLRQLGTPSEAGDSYWWLNDARNKECITLDLRQDQGQAIFKTLVAKADVLVENFRPGTLERWGLGFDTLLAINPKLVMLRVSAYGQTGPKSSLPGFARIAQAYGGLSYLTGLPETEPLTPGSSTLADYLTGLYGVFGIMLALRARDRFGYGQFIDMGLHDGIFRFLDEIAAVYDKTGEVRERAGAEVPNSAPHSHYPCQDGHWVAIACTNDKMFKRLSVVMNQPELADKAQYGLRRNRLAARKEVNALVREFTMSYSCEEILKRCAEGDVPCGKICSIADIFNEEQFWVRDTLMRIEDPRVGSLAIQGVVPKLSKTPGEVRHLGVELSKDTHNVLQELAGVDPGEFDALKKLGVI